MPVSAEGVQPHALSPLAAERKVRRAHRFLSRHGEKRRVLSRQEGGGGGVGFNASIDRGCRGVRRRIKRDRAVGIYCAVQMGTRSQTILRSHAERAPGTCMPAVANNRRVACPGLVGRRVSVAHLFSWAKRRASVLHCHLFMDDTPTFFFLTSRSISSRPTAFIWRTKLLDRRSARLMVPRRLRAIKSDTYSKNTIIISKKGEGSSLVF